MARNPVTFSNGTLVQKAQVEVDGTTYEVEPAQFSGTTPLSASNLNLLQTRLYDYVDEEISNLNTVQTFTETVTYSGSSSAGQGIQITTLWKRTGKVVNLFVEVYIPKDKRGVASPSNFIFNIPEWVKPTNTSNFLNYDNNNHKILGHFIDFTLSNTSFDGFVKLDLITHQTYGMILYGPCYNNDTENDRNYFGTITYILD